MRKHLLIILILFLSKGFVIAQTADATDCADYPYFKRLLGTFIIECFKDSDEVDITIEPDSSIIIAGLKTFISYGYNPAMVKGAPTFAQIVKTYENVVIKNGGRRMYYSDEGGKSTLFFMKNNKEIWTIVDDGSGDGEGYYTITVLETVKQ